MLIKNNKPKAAMFHYKVGGKIFRYLIPGLTTVDILDLTDTSQIVSNTYDRRIRHIEDKLGYNFSTTFEEPGDPDFPTFSIISSSSSFGTISPVGLTRVARGENVTYTMGAIADTTFTLTAHTTNESYGSISPSATSVSSFGYYYLNSLLVNGNNFISAVTGTLSAVSTYTLAEVSSAGTVVSNFVLSATPSSQTFTIQATAMPGYVLTAHTSYDMFGAITSSSGITSASNYYYLSSLLVDSVEAIGDVTGTTSATTTYVKTITTNHDINPVFTYYQETKRFEMTASTAVAVVFSALTQGESGGTISPSGMTVDATQYYYLASLLIDSVEKIGSVIGITSATTTYDLIVFGNHDVNPIFGSMPATTDFTMTPNTNYYLKGLFVDSVDKISEVLGDKHLPTTYSATVVYPSVAGKIIEALFAQRGGSINIDSVSIPGIPVVSINVLLKSDKGATIVDFGTFSIDLNLGASGVAEAITNQINIATATHHITAVQVGVKVNCTYTDFGEYFTAVLYQSDLVNVTSTSTTWT